MKSGEMTSYRKGSLLLSAGAGDIVAISGIEVPSGTTLADESLNIRLSPMFVPNPVISMAAKVSLLSVF